MPGSGAPKGRGDGVKRGCGIGDEHRLAVHASKHRALRRRAASIAAANSADQGACLRGLFKNLPASLSRTAPPIAWSVLAFA
jgi:hypothetical protein